MTRAGCCNGPFVGAVLPLAIYILLATGTIFPVEAAGSWAAIYFLVVAGLSTTFLARVQDGVVSNGLAAIICVLGPLCFIYLVSSVRALDEAATLRRLDGAIATCALSVLLVAAAVRNYGEPVFKVGFLRAALVILVLTLFYKAKYGFVDRDVRFFINGPIVFGWLMGFCALTVLHGVIHGMLRWRWLAVLSCFIIAALWTQSKGPLLAFGVTSALVLLWNLGRSRTYLVSGFFVGFAIAVMALIPEDFGSRFLTIARVFMGAADEGDYGSVGYRQEAWHDAVKMFLEHPLMGVGVSNWQFFSRVGELQYPHNVFLELGAETGLLGLLAMTGALGYLVLRSSGWGRITIVYFAICCSFSGDFSYFRFIVAIPLGLLVADVCRKRDAHGRTVEYAKI